MANLYKEFVEENGLTANFDKWAKARKLAKGSFEFTLGKEVSLKDLEDGKCYWTDKVDRDGPEAWMYSKCTGHLVLGGEYMPAGFAKKFFEITPEQFEEYKLTYWEKRYGKQFVKDYRKRHGIK